MKHFILTLFFTITTGALFSQSVFYGYREDCLEMQTEKIDKIFKNVIGYNRYEQLKDLNSCNIDYKLGISVKIDSLGIVTDILIKDIKDFLIEGEFKRFKDSLNVTIFDICITESEYAKLNKTALFSVNGTIRFGIFLPIRKK